MMRMVFIVKNAVGVSSRDMFIHVLEYASDPVHLVDSPVHENDLDTTLEEKYCFVKNFRTHRHFRMRILDDGINLIESDGEEEMFISNLSLFEVLDHHGEAYLIRDVRGGIKLCDLRAGRLGGAGDILNALAYLYRVGKSSIYMMMLNPDFVISDGHPIIKSGDIFYCRGLNHTAGTVRGIDSTIGGTEDQSFFNIAIEGILGRIDNTLLVDGSEIRFDLYKNVETECVPLSVFVQNTDIILESNLPCQVRDGVIHCTTAGMGMKGYLAFSIKGDCMNLLDREYIFTRC